jgi:hypothetical protein
MNAIAEKAAYYARIAQYASDGFSQVYLGAKDVAPTADNNGNPLIVGALYYNTVDDLIYTWDGAIWSAILVGTNTNQTITGVKTFTQPIVGSITGNAGTATTLQTGRTIGISGSITGTATLFNGATGITIPTTITTGATITSPNLAGTATGALTSKVVQGVTDGTLAATGFIGEIIQATQLTSNISPDATTNGATITLTPGVWDVSGSASFGFNSVVCEPWETIAAGISNVSNTLQNFRKQEILIPASVSITKSPAFELIFPIVRFNVTSDTPIYVVIASPDYEPGGATMTYESSIRATRVM